MLIAKLTGEQFRLWNSGQRGLIEFQIREAVGGRPIQIRQCTGRVLTTLSGAYQQDVLTSANTVVNFQIVAAPDEDNLGPGIYDFNTGARVRCATALDIEQYLKAQAKGQDYKVDGCYYFIPDEELKELEESKERGAVVYLRDFNSGRAEREATAEELADFLAAKERDQDYKTNGRYYTVS